MTKRFSARNNQGQTAAEFALVLPLLALLLFAVIQFGTIFHHYVTITDAARAGARQGAVARHVTDPEGTTEQAVRDSAQNLDQAQLDVSVSATPDWERGADVTVSASYPYSIDLLWFVVADGNLTSTTKERIE